MHLSKETSMEHGLSFPLQWLTPNVARPVQLMVTLLWCCIIWKNTNAIFVQSCCCDQLAREKLESYTSVAILPSFSYDHYWFHLHTLMLFHHVGSTIASDSFWLSCPSCKNVWPCGRNQWTPHHTQLALEGDMLKRVWWLRTVQKYLFCIFLTSVLPSEELVL